MARELDGEPIASLRLLTCAPGISWPGGAQASDSWQSAGVTILVRFRAAAVAWDSMRAGAESSALVWRPLGDEEDRQEFGGEHDIWPGELLDVRRGNILLAETERTPVTRTHELA